MKDSVLGGMKDLVLSWGNEGFGMKDLVLMKVLVLGVMKD